MNESDAQELIRSHLANERTHLAYLRTSLALISFGVTLNRISIFLQKVGKINDIHAGVVELSHTAIFGFSMVVVGIMLLFWSLVRYRQVTNDIIDKRYKNPYYAVIVLTLFIIICGAVSAYWIILSGDN